MQGVLPGGFATCPNDVLIVEDDPLIAMDFEDTLLGLGVSAVRTAGTVATALEMIARRAPDFALLDVGLIHEKSFAVAERLASLKIPFAFVTGYAGDVLERSLGADANIVETVAHMMSAKRWFPPPTEIARRGGLRREPSRATR